MIKLLLVTILVTIGIIIGRYSVNDDCDIMIVRSDDLYRSNKKYSNETYIKRPSDKLFQQRSWK